MGNPEYGLSAHPEYPDVMIVTETWILDGSEPFILLGPNNPSFVQFETLLPREEAARLFPQETPHD